jgi:hypothetical protein
VTMNEEETRDQESMNKTKKQLRDPESDEEDRLHNATYHKDRHHRTFRVVGCLNIGYSEVTIWTIRSMGDDG